MNSNLVQDNLKKVPKINNASQKAKSSNDVLLAKQNLQNLLGQTVQNTIFLDEQNQNNVQQINKNQNNTNENTKIPQTRKSNSLDKQNLKNKNENNQNNKNIKKRNSDAKKIMNQNGINNVGQNLKKLPSKGLYGEMKKLNSIVKNGKLICNIDINEESQGMVSTDYNKPHFTNNKNINDNQGVTPQKKYSNTPTGVNNNQPQHVVPAKNINQNIPNIQNVKSNPQLNSLQIKNKNESINNQNEIIKTVTSIYLNQNDKNVNSNINQFCSQNSVQSKAFNEQSANPSQNILDTKQIIPGETVKSIYEIKGSNQNSNILSQLCIGQTVKSVYSGEVKENPYPGIMPNKTINSVYPIKESGNPINKSESPNLLSQMAPGATVKSVYPQQDASHIKGLSQMIPAETVKSVYTKKDSHTLFSQMVPGSTSKSVYTNKK